MAGMFYGCSGLTSLDVSGFNTANVTNMAGMFYGCSGLTSLDVSGFNTANVTNMAGMFYGCSGLTSLDVSGFNTANVTNMAGMFYGCSGLTSLDVSGFNTANVTNMYGMFYDCSGLTSLDVSGFNTENVTDMNGMFNGCSGLTSLDVSDFNTANVTDMNCMFNGCSGLTSLGVSGFNTGKVTDMRDMFNGCSSLTSLDLSRFNTANVTNMTGMFSGCAELVTIYANDNFSTSKAGESTGLFSGCVKLKSTTAAYDSDKTGVDMANCNTGYFTYKKAPAQPWAEYDSNTTTLTFKYGDKPSTFGEGITAYDLNEGSAIPGWVYVTDITKVVFDASFNDARPTSCYAWFYRKNNLAQIDGIQYLHTDKVRNMSLMFYNCAKLPSFDLSGFNTEKVKNMTYMFVYCQAATTLDLSGFNTANVTGMEFMFYGCTALTTIYASDKFSMSNVENSNQMFSDCTSLVGAVKYDANSTDATMANYKTGYFKTYYKVGGTQYDMCGEPLSVTNLELEDGKDFVALAPFKANSASYSRTMTSNWGTLCLPFAVETSNATDSKFYALESVDNDVITLTELKGTIGAGTPVLVYSTNGLNISASNVNVVTAPADGAQASDYQLVGSFAETEVPDNGYIISKNKFWLTSDLKSNTSVKAVKTKGLRSWLKSDSYSNEAQARVLGFAFDDENETTAIEAVDGLAEGTAEIYDIQGRRTDRLQKGLNIVKKGGVTTKVMVK